MVDKQDVIGIIRKNFPEMQREYFIKKIALFGSYANGNYTSQSDVDLIVEFEKPIGFGFIRFSEYMEKLLGKRVDILTFQGVNSIRVYPVMENIKRSLIYV